MTSQATVVSVMIASPADVAAGREAVYRALTSWNESRALDRRIVLLPLRWESGTVPVLGDHPQAIINRQLLDRADIVIALFGSRLGSATPTALSGTVEEIDRAVEGGKPVHLYFSTAPLPYDVDANQLTALRNFRTDLEQHGLLGSYANVDELGALIWQAIEHDLSAIDAVPNSVNAGLGVDILAQRGSERSQETDSRGRLRSKVHKWIDIINRGQLDAEEVIVEPVGEGIYFFGFDEPRTLHSGQSQRVPFELSLAAAGHLRVRVTWVEEGQRRVKEFDV